MEYQLSELARNDLEDIWEYSFKNWSIKQADKYITQIIKEIENICQNPLIGKSISTIKPNHRMLRVNFHLIIYKVASDGLKVDRILHERMDFENQF